MLAFLSPIFNIFPSNAHFVVFRNFCMGQLKSTKFNVENNTKIRNALKVDVFEYPNPILSLNIEKTTRLKILKN